MDKLVKDAADARKHGMTYGKWMVKKNEAKKLPKKGAKKNEVSGVQR